MDNLSLSARLFPAGTAPTSEKKLNRVAPGVYTGTFALPAPTFEGYVQVWVNESATPRREAVTDYTLGGNPGRAWANGAPCGSPGRAWANGAPVISADGQAMLYDQNLPLAEGSFFVLQATTNLPTAPSWATNVAQAYRITANVALPTDMSISFSYLGSDVPAGEEGGLRVYYWNEAKRTWEVLPTVQNTIQNIVSARIRGPGLYALMSSIEIPLNTGWNQISYPVSEVRPVRDALHSIDGYYTTLYTYDASNPNGPWLVFDVNQPDRLNTLRNLEPGRGYLIYATQAVTLRLKGPIGVSLTTLSRITMPQPPATYYGTVQPNRGFAPQPGMQVLASVNGILCGQGRTLEINGQVMYSVSVDASGVSDNGCGMPGRLITFQVDSQIMGTTAVWQSNHARELPLSR